jgi:RsiW-degrading membrane proteinase PrsW (M82 family)
MSESTGLIISLIFGFIPMFLFAYIIFWTDRYEKEPLHLLVGAFFWGMVIAAGGAFIINTILGLGIFLFTNSVFATELATSSIIAPIVEESLKGLGVLLVFFFFYNEFDSILDGIVYAAITALGFAAVENSYYIYTFGYLEGGAAGTILLIFVRVILVGWQHPFYTAFIGIGLAVARLNKKWFVRFLAPFAGWVLAVLTHAAHNTLAGILPSILNLTIGTLLDWGGWLLMALFMVWAIFRERSWITLHLQEEVANGIISQAQYSTACSTWAQSGARISALFSGRYKATHRFFQVCAELAQKKEQFANMGDEGGNQAAIEKYRAELSALSGRVQI